MYNTGVEAIIAGLIAACMAQIIKVILYVIVHRKINFKILTTTGGMPSSHSAGVVALAVSIGLIDGFMSTTFAVAFGFSLVVIQDAQGIRRAAGKTAATLNRLVNEWKIHNEETKPYEVLKELLGHTPFEVLMGMLLGVIVALLVHFQLPNYLDLNSIFQNLIS